MLLKRHFVENQGISSICEEAQIGPSQFYTWQRLLFEKGTQVRPEPRPEIRCGGRGNRPLGEKVREKDEVIAELMAKYLKQKKEWGGLVKDYVSDERRRKIVEFIGYWTGKAALTAKWMATLTAIRVSVNP